MTRMWHGRRRCYLGYHNGYEVIGIPYYICNRKVRLQVDIYSIKFPYERDTYPYSCTSCFPVEVRGNGTAVVLRIVHRSEGVGV